MGEKTTCAPSPKETPWAALTSWKRTMFMLWKSDFWALAVSVFYTIITQKFKEIRNRKGERFLSLVWTFLKDLWSFYKFWTWQHWNCKTSANLKLVKSMLLKVCAPKSNFLHIKPETGNRLHFASDFKLIFSWKHSSTHNLSNIQEVKTRIFDLKSNSKKKNATKIFHQDFRRKSHPSWYC